jgi:thioredoxin-like negative regulator of GroEL
VVVGSTYEQIVNDPQKDVLVNYFAPWCGFSKKLEPIWEQLAWYFKYDPNLVIAKFDATQNDLIG